jgi:hypothetical protein
MEEEEVQIWLYCFFNLGVTWEWVVNATPQLLAFGKETRQPL